MAEDLEAKKASMRDKYAEDIVAFTRDIIGNDKMSSIHYTFQSKVLLPLLHKQAYEGLAIGFRGCGKTSLLTVGFIIHQIAYNRNIRILLVSENEALSKAMLRTIRSHLETNKKLISLYGKFVGQPWTDSEFVVSGREAREERKEPTLKAAGLDVEVTSGHYDIVILDDVNAKNRCKTQQGRESVWQYYVSCMPIVEKGNNPGFLLITGTFWHYDDLPSRIINDPALIARFAYCNIPVEVDGVPTWPEEFPESVYLPIKEKDFVFFSTQYMNDTSATKNTQFSRSFIKNISEEEYKEVHHSACMHIKVDLGGSLKVNDPYAIVYLAALPDRRIIVYDYVERQFTIDDVAEFLISEYARLRSECQRCVIVIEMVGWQKTFTEVVQSICRAKTLPFPIIQRIDDRLSKRERFNIVVPYFAAGRIFLRSTPSCARFANRIIDFGSSNGEASDHASDALGFGIENTIYPRPIYKTPEEVPLEKFLDTFIQKEPRRFSSDVASILA